MLQDRHSSILGILKKERTANVKYLAQKLYVSEATVRRDLKVMQSLGLVERSHGGAMLPDNGREISLFIRMTKNAQAKQALAFKALPLLPEFGCVFIDSSSTALALAEKMNLRFKTVVTNNLQTALHLSKNENLNLIFIGGVIQHSTIATTGSWSTRQIEEFHFDLMLLSCAAVMDEEVYETSLEQKEIKLAAFKRSKRKILLVDRSKFSAKGIHKLANLEDFDLVITED